jgi:hypothetical protein
VLVGRNAEFARESGALTALQFALNLFDRVQQLPAGLLATAAGLGAHPAVFMHPGMPFALVAKLLHTAAQTPRSGSVTLGSYSAWRHRTAAVAVQTSAQSRHSRMHVTISTTFCSPRSQSESATHVRSGEGCRVRIQAANEMATFR